MSLRGGDPAEIGGYPLEARLGSGGMGTVFLARTSSGRPVAIKLIHQQFAGDDEFRIRFRQEVAAARRVSGAFTAAVVDAAPEAEQPWMATTYIEGHTLAQRIATKGPLNGAELRRLAIGLAEALRDIHRVGVVHRDLKPSNVVLSPEGPRVIDFGISRAVDQQTLTMTGRVIGTPPFMSPEQLQAPRGVGPRSDVFSLGTLLVYAATGHGPFDADSPYMTAYQVVHEEPSLGAVPLALRAVVEPCLDKEPEGRPSADELLVLLRDLPADLGTTDANGVGAGRTRDVITQHFATQATPAPTAPTTAPAGPGTGSTGTPIGRRLRSRWRPVLAAAVAVAAIGGGVAALKAGDFGENSGGDKGNSVAAPGAVLPDGFEPWRKTVQGGREDIPDELRCVARGDALFCGGGGVVATRIRAVDGSRVWTAKSPGIPVQGMHLVGATDDTVLGYRFAAEDAPQDPPTEVVAIDANNGRELWSVTSGARSMAVTGRTQDAIVVGSAVVTVDASNSRFEARDAHSGEVTWTTPFPAGTQCAPVPVGPQLLAMCATDVEVDASEVRHPTLHTVDRASGTLGRSIAVDGPAVPMGVANGGLVLLQEHREGTALVGYDGVARVDPASRKVTYSRLAKTYAGTPGMADGTVYVSGQTGLVTALDPATGRKKWSRQTSVEGASGPVAGADALYFSSATGRVVALSPHNGKPLWTTDPQADGLTGEQGASPRVTVAGRAVIVAAAKNTLFAFDAQKPPKVG
ncbi:MULTISPECIES: protein kinase domain-containing protein [unclassified Streptomyces]|uniref:serine/threonine-protein kinase n=1 Tax=unclassified Streptomyces TaxID=2593676 RepID=UPI002E80C30B|nr:PQQ-binding-like beta-propeller repeat protein [Streptomyces sp. NBC_00562]WTC84099.1 serine/threonine-protein kinase [Streptomyces sp. NBC_01653]WTD86766.1 serine/threonine-protein kinase [Streptomyces sp. NBC_01637]WUC17850.1 serine/threonine-protein kinase [Streptomyces sp. NBC_00562]